MQAVLEVGLAEERELGFGLGLGLRGLGLGADQATAQATRAGPKRGSDATGIATSFSQFSFFVMKIAGTGTT